MLKGLAELYGEVSAEELGSLGLRLPDDHLSRIDELCPPAFSGGAMEWPLIGPARIPDIWATIPFDACGQSVIRKHLDDGGWGRDDWQVVLELARNWVQPGSAADQYISDLHLEFDTSTGSQSPIVVGGLRHDQGSVESRMAAVNAYLGSSIEAQRTVKLQHLMARVPAHVYLRHIAIMQARGEEAVRLVLTVRAMDLPNVVEILGWEGESVAPLSQFLATSHQVLGVQYEPAETLNRLSIEIYPRAFSDEAYHWRLFEFLQEQGAMDSLWAGRMKDWLRIGPGDERSLLIKLTCAVQQPMVSKAYAIFP